jgi:fructoselysine-6-P-deglycase FrlB-like protein
MIGGLRSIIELGMAGIAIANFYNYASDIVKKMIDFIKSAGAKILKFLHRKFAAKMLNNLAQPDRRMKTIKALIFNFVRVVALLMLGLSAKLKMDIKKDNS